jgi:hypothetical protein
MPDERKGLHSTDWETEIVGDRKVRSYAIWDHYAGTYYAINAPWQLELQNRLGSREERKVYRQFLATHKRRYLSNEGVKKALYIFTAGSLNRHPRQLDRFAQFFSDLKVWAQDDWDTIADKISVVVVNGQSKGRYTGTMFSGMYRGKERTQYKSVVYVDAYGFMNRDSIPDKALISWNDRIFESAERYYDEIKNSPSTVEQGLADWLGQHTNDMTKRGESVKGFKALNVFISYCREDLVNCVSLRNLLETNGLNPWIDMDIHPGEKWRDRVIAKLGKATCGILLNSANSLESQWCQLEAVKLAERNRLLATMLDNSRLMETIDRIQVLPTLQDWDGSLEDPAALALVNDVEGFLHQKRYL